MNLTPVAIATRLVTGDPVPRGRVRFDLQVAGRDGGVVVPATPAVATLDDDGLGSVTLWGGAGAKYTVTIINEAGRVQFTGEASVPTYACNLHEILDLVDEPPGDAEAAKLEARDWAIKMDGPVEGGEFSSKYHATQAKADREQADLDAEATAGDRIQTGLDRQQTGLDRTSAAIDRAAADGSASLANGAMLTAVAQAALASIYALAAASVVSQDLSGTIAAATHRSPNTILATAIYNVSDDTDPQWPDRATHLLNRPLNGAYIPSSANSSGQGITSEIVARALGGTLGAELVNNGTFSNGTLAGWALQLGIAGTVNASGQAVLTNGGGNRSVYSQPVNVTVGKTYILMVGTLAGSGAGSVRLGNINDFTSVNYANMTPASMAPVVFTPTQATIYLSMGPGTGTPGDTGIFDNISIREVQAYAPSGSYYPNATDGKFYRLWKNLVRYAQDLTQASAWTRNNIQSVTSKADGFGDLIVANTTAGQQHWLEQAVTGSQTSVPKTVTIRAKAGGYSFLYVNFAGGAAGGQFDLSTGTAYGTGNTMTAVPGMPGYYDCVLPVGSAPANVQFLLGPQIALNGFNYAGDGVSGIYVAQTQIEYGTSSTAQEAKGGDTSQTETFDGNTGKWPRQTLEVLEQTRLVIYDLVSPGRPMYMVASAGPTGANVNSTWALGRAVATKNCLAVGQGRIVIGSAAAAAESLTIMDLAADRFTQYSNSAFGCVLPHTIATRHVVLNAQVGTLPTLASTIVNGVDMCVMPDAPVDPLTGLAVPTIAVGGPGCSIIKHDGTVVTSVNTGTVTGIYITPEVMSCWNQGSAQWQFYPDPGKLAANWAQNAVTSGHWTTLGMVDIKALNRHTIARRSGSRVSLMRLNQSTVGASLYADIDAAYNTGWLCGDIRRAHACDTMTGALDPTEKVTNGNFAADLSGWTAGALAPASVVWNAGAARFITGASSNDANLDQQMTLVPGRTYVLQFTWTAVAVASANAVLQVRIGNTAGGSEALGAQTMSVPQGGVWTASYTFMATQAAQFIRFINTTDNVATTADLDGVSVIECVADRSYKSRPLLVYGTGLSRAAVATGAQLTAVSGFSSTSYLREPGHSVDLDPGTGPLRLVDWVNVGANPQLAQNIWPKSNLFGAGSNWNQSGLTPADGSLTTGGHTYALLQQPAASTGSNNITAFTPITALNVNCNVSLLVRRNGASTDRLQIAAINMAGSSTNVYDPVTQTWTSGGGAGWTITPIDANTARISASGLKGANLTSGYWALQVARASDGAVFGGGTGGLYVAEFQITIGSALLPYEDVPGAVTIRCHPSKEYSYANGAYYTLGIGGDGFPMVEVYDTVTKRTASASSIANATTGDGYNTLGFVQLAGEYQAGTLWLKVNGQPIVQTSGAPLLTLTNVNAVLTVGQNYALTAPFPGSVCLGKVGMTLATPDSGPWMFDQEKQMFATGAQVTLPDAGTVADISWDKRLGQLVATSAANESMFSGVVRASSAPAVAGSNSKISAGHGAKAITRTTTYPGVDVTLVPRNLREELQRRDEAAARAQRGVPVPPLDWQGAFTANTLNNSPQITVTGNSLQVPAGATLVGARVTGTGIPAGTTVLAVNGTQVQLSAACTALGAGVTVSILDLVLPGGQSPNTVRTAGVVQREGTTQAWTRGFDGFRESVGYIGTPGNQWLQVETRRAA